VRVRCCEDKVALDLGVDDLANYVRIGKADDQAILWRIVLVFGLSDKALASIVVSFALSASAVLGLVPLKVGLVLNEFDERLYARGDGGEMRDWCKL